MRCMTAQPNSCTSQVILQSPKGVDEHDYALTVSGRVKVRLGEIRLRPLERGIHGDQTPGVHGRVVFFASLDPGPIGLEFLPAFQRVVSPGALLGPTSSTVGPSSPTRRVAHNRARSISAAFGRIAAQRSLQVRRWHAGSAQRHTRLRHTNVTGRPPLGRHAPHAPAGPCTVATTPQPSQPAGVEVVSTSAAPSSVSLIAVTPHSWRRSAELTISGGRSKNGVL